MVIMYSILHDSVQLDLRHSIDVPRCAAFTSCNGINACSREAAFNEESKIPILKFLSALAGLLCGEICF